MFLGLILGNVAYLLTISKFVIKISVTIILTVKKVIFKLLQILTFPVKCILKIFRNIFNKPLMLFVVNVRKLSKNVKIKKKI